MKPGKKKEKQGTMKREIKFRAWDNKEKKWLLGYEYPNLGGFSMVGEVMLFQEWSNVINRFILQQKDRTPDDLIIMQFTGLLDKNGKEIFEGDIVKRSTLNHEWDDDNSNVPKYIEQVSFVEYRSNGFWVNAEDFGWEGENLWTWNLMEVIGNIYEHPSLLQSTPKQEQ